MISITPSSNEFAAGRLAPETVARAVHALKDDGFVVLTDVVPLPIIEQLRDRMMADATALLARPDRPFNWTTGNLQQDPPPVPPYLHREVLCNEFAIQVTKEILGAGMFNAMYSGNNALPSDQRQPVHADQGHLWPNLEHPHPPYAIVVNVPLVDVSSANGSTEIWPQTHKDLSVTMQGDIKVTEEAMAKWRAEFPPIQPEIKAGSILIRDIRLWHAGMPNHTQVMRPMIAMIHHVNWWPAGKFPLHKSAEELLAHPDLRQNARWVEEDYDHINAPQAYEYSNN